MFTKDEQLAQLVNNSNKGVCRTAPATQGLLKKLIAAEPMEPTEPMKPFLYTFVCGQWFICSFKNTFGELVTVYHCKDIWWYGDSV